jgi:hypothetical protein
MTDISNPRAVVGDNIGVDQAEIVNSRLAQDYAESAKALSELRAEAAPLKETKCTSDNEAVERGGVIKRFRDLDKRLEAFREAEKQPFLRGGNAVDSFFFAMRDLIGKRNKNDRSVKPGDADILQATIDDFQQEKINKERARLLAEQQERDRVAREEATRLRKAQEEADEAARAAARARSPETRAAKGEYLATKEGEAALAKAQAELAQEQADEARLATLVKPADISRVRGVTSGGGGVLLTTAREPYAILTDRAKLDMNALRPYFTDAEIEKALRGWARATGHKVQMEGAEIGVGNKGVTR